MNRFHALITLSFSIAVVLLQGCDTFYFEAIRVNVRAGSTNASDHSSTVSVNHAYELVLRTVREISATDPLLTPRACRNQYYLCEAFGKGSFGLTVYITNENKNIINVKLSEFSRGPSKAGTELLNTIMARLSLDFEKKGIERGRIEFPAE